MNLELELGSTSKADGSRDPNDSGQVLYYSFRSNGAEWEQRRDTTSEVLSDSL